MVLCCFSFCFCVNAERPGHQFNLILASRNLWTLKGLAPNFLELPIHLCHFIFSVELNRKCLEQGILSSLVAPPIPYIKHE